MKNWKILLLEDLEYDVELIQYELTKSGLSFTLKNVCDEKGFVDALVSFSPDIVLADYKLPFYNGLEALAYCVQNSPDTPFIFVTGALGEERALETLRKGAKDFLLKSQLPKLPQIVLRALEEKTEKRNRQAAEQALQESEEHLRNLMRISPTGIFRCNLSGDCIYVNDKWCEITSLNHKQAVGNGWMNTIHPEDQEMVAKAWYNFLEGKPDFYAEYRISKPDGNVFWVISTGLPEKNTQGKTVGYIGNITDITKLKKTEIELTAKNQILEKVNQELDRFVYSASHDLKAPLTSMLGLISILKVENNPEEKEKIISMMENSISILEGYIKDVVNHTKNTRIETRKDTIFFEKFILGILEELNQLYTEVSIEKKINIRQDKAFCSDTFRLNLILRNIISNAIKYRKQGQHNPYIQIDVNASDSIAEIVISDRGEGIDSVYLPKIFDMFYRASETQSGSGLGLYITKEAVEKTRRKYQCSLQKRGGHHVHHSTPGPKQVTGC